MRGVRGGIGLRAGFGCWVGLAGFDRAFKPVHILCGCGHLRTFTGQSTTHGPTRCYRRDPKKNATSEALAWLTRYFQDFQDALEAPDWLRCVPPAVRPDVLQLRRLSNQPGTKAGQVCATSFSADMLQSGSCVCHAATLVQPHPRLHQLH